MMLMMMMIDDNHHHHYYLCSILSSQSSSHLFVSFREWEMMLCIKTVAGLHLLWWNYMVIRSLYILKLHVFLFFFNILCIKTITSYHLFLLSSCPIWSYRILQWPCLEMHRQMGSATFLVNATDFDYLIISHVVLIHITSQSFA